MSADINLGGQQWTPIGVDGEMSFSGTFYGDGKTVSNFKIDNSDYDGYYPYQEAGLFGYVIGNIFNLGVTDFVISVERGDGFICAGGLAGELENGSIVNCYATGSISSSGDSDNYVGGLVGYLSDNGSIANCYATGSVSSSGDSDNYVGGFVGYQGGTITSSYATGSVSASSSAYAGGFVGYREASMAVSYAAGYTEGCVFDAQGTGQKNGVGDGSADGVTPKTNAEMTSSGLGGLGGEWDLNDGYYPQISSLANHEELSIRAASAFSVVPVLFGNETDTSKSVASPFRVPKKTPNGDNKEISWDYSPDILTIGETEPISDYSLLTPKASGSVSLFAVIPDTTMKKEFPLNIIYGSPTPPSEPSYGISLDPAENTYTFPGAFAGYESVTPLEITVINTGDEPTGPLSVLLSGADSANFTLSDTSLNSIAVGGEDIFSIAPVISLDIGTYTASVTVSGDHGLTASLGLSFTVSSSDSGFIPVTDLSLSFSSLTLTVGDSQTLDALVAPDNATSNDIDWEIVDNKPLYPDLYPLVLKIEPNNVTLRDRTCTSSNTQALAAATRRLTVTALGPGTAAIKATALGGDFTVLCPVSVSPAAPEPPAPEPPLSPDPLLSPDLPPEYKIVSPDILIEGTVTPDAETVPPCTLALQEEGTEYAGQVGRSTASGAEKVLYRPKAEEVLAYGAERRFVLDRNTLETVLELIYTRKGKSIPLNDIIANPVPYLDDLFSVLLFQQEIAEGPHTGVYVWLVPGVIEPAEAVRQGIVTFLPVEDGLEAVFKFFVADDIKYAKFMNGELIVGDGSKNGLLTDLIWLNARSPAGGREIDGGGCRQGRVPGPVMVLMGVALLALLGRRVYR
ncbi:MAG: hypothetical protein LBR71_04210 [Synergistaceae bacterium]|nr:hypothetical protein [Synergistaceae bacterium]